MRSKTTMAFRRLALCAVPLMLTWGLAATPARAQDATAAVQAPAQTQTPTEAQLPEGQIEQLVAPIALYPDPLLTQVLMASTYPLEVVEAARWSHDNSTVSGQALQDAMQAQSWDPSVKALTAVPQTLQMTIFSIAVCSAAPSGAISNSRFLMRCNAARRAERGPSPGSRANSWIRRSISGPATAVGIKSNSIPAAAAIRR